MGRKATRAETDARILTILGFLKELKPRSFIRQFAAEQWGLGGRQADELTARAYKLLHEDWGQQRKDLAAQCLSQAQEILELAKDSKQLSNSIGALRLIAELGRLTPKER